MDFMSLRFNSSSLTCFICALAAIILQFVAMECRKLHMVDSPIGTRLFGSGMALGGGFSNSLYKIWQGDNLSYILQNMQVWKSNNME